MMADLLLNLSSLYLSSWIVELKANSQKLPPKAGPPQVEKAVFAEVVKLANTLRSGRSGRKSLRVQLPPSAVFLYSSRQAGASLGQSFLLDRICRMNRTNPLSFESVNNCLIKMKGVKHT